jgi:hypothetical protein
MANSRRSPSSGPDHRATPAEIIDGDAVDAGERGEGMGTHSAVEFCPSECCE